MRKVTKIPKRVKVEWKESTCLRSWYLCPRCKACFDGFVSENVTRFICQCGQELIVDEEAV